MQKKIIFIFIDAILFKAIEFFFSFVNHMYFNISVWVIEKINYLEWKFFPRLHTLKYEQIVKIKIIKKSHERHIAFLQLTFLFLSFYSLIEMETIWWKTLMSHHLMCVYSCRFHLNLWNDNGNKRRCI